MSDEYEQTEPNEPPEEEEATGQALVPIPAEDERRRPGRPKGSLNQKTVAMRNAIAAVFEDLQTNHEGEGRYPHFYGWAKENPTEFYRIAARQMPVPFENIGRTIGVVVFKGINDD